MENQNVLTIKFNTLDDLASQVSEWSERLNHTCCCGGCHSEDKPANEVSAAEPAVDEPVPAEPEEVIHPESNTEPDPERPELEKAIDKNEFYNRFKKWMGKDMDKASKAFNVFKKHGVSSKINSDVLTEDIITDLKTIMAE